MTQTLRVGVIGTGAMGADHVRTLHRWVPAARVVAVQDLDVARAKHLATEVGAEVAASAEDLIDPATVDAVVIASPDPTHAPLARAAIAAGLPVLCEKPLGTDPDESRSVVDAELAAGRRLVTVGFMRRFDPGYVSLKEAVAAGRVGSPRLVHNIHRNRVGHPSATTEGIVVNSMIHELDIVPWLLDSPIEQIEVTSPVADGFRDPQLAVLKLANGTLATVEVFIEAAYGYDVRCEVVGTGGTAALVPPALVAHAAGGVAGADVPPDFRPRFADAYRLELAAWADSVLDGVPVGPTAWEGHRATVVAAAGVASLREGRAVPVPQEPCPDLYV
ncbi:inositol 2-dehydrogenase [Aeromicrobium camelliae]|uniref:Inositol 2-dehydrogenase n=1 Tax=Aeromicrobium camelliae TaxID=1538144 RepID=A0A3N6WTK2_9ACTN|nr:Gfo/Idh/MocA family oxidoreductase [Aeromicrobium camelliae]RQN08362.1 inositol 2-dehydrogenase [Aeromicrobium camelliae]